MREHIAADEEFERTDVPAAEAIERFRGEDQPYKVELIEDLVRDEGVETVSLYRNGPFTDLCRGPARPLDRADRGDQAQLARGRLLARRRDPPDADPDLRDRLLQQEGPEGAPGADRAGEGARPPQARSRARAVHAPRGGARDALLAAAGDRPAEADPRAGRRAARRSAATSRSARREILDVELWHRSGHYDNYRENMYFAEPADRDRGDERRFAVKPMNCPGACLVFGSERHSYRELPLRLAEYGNVSRFEREGVLHGLLRVRAFTQDDAHVYCTPRPDRGRGGRHLRGDRRALRQVRLHRRPARALDPAGEVDRRGRGVGAGRGGARLGARLAAAASTSSTPATAPSTAPRSTSTSPTPSAAPGSSAPARSTSSCPSASTSATRAPTTPTTAR